MVVLKTFPFLVKSFFIFLQTIYCKNEPIKYTIKTIAGTSSISPVLKLYEEKANIIDTTNETCHASLAVAYSRLFPKSLKYLLFK